ncbi:hypothetical protein [Saccharopolyspora gregorii]|uniref:hypothetical protein n=1 Tax=Saccharopolyspora gregorii TaxID=33914 RepID=UPI0021AC05C8|nr:hypothetical protein [Saccharopolyspora gregorii]
MVLADEIARVEESTALTGFPAGAVLSHAVAACPADAEPVLARAREVLSAVLRALEAGRSPVERIPDWFRQEGSIGGTDRWSLSAWLHWFTAEERHWYWWGADVVAPGTVRVAVATADEPVALGSLEWLLLAAGAARVDVVVG